MNNDDVLKLFNALYADVKPENSFPAKKPLLAHYTTMQALEKILSTNEVWFSNPLYMNDVSEVRFGVNEGHALMMASPEIAAACKTPERAEIFKFHFNNYYLKFANEHVLNTYVFCLSEHDPKDDDGLLSMWRGYGGNGNGVAIVFDTAQLRVIENSALIISEVTYDTTQARMDWLAQLSSTFEKILGSSDIQNDQLYIPAYLLFERIKLFALFTKHRGFEEEDEWRIVYMPDRDQEEKLAPMFKYFMGPRGIEPKLKFKVEPVKGITADDLSLTMLTERIILGPSISTPMTKATIERMFDLLAHSGLKSKIRGSTIPFRALG